MLSESSSSPALPAGFSFFCHADSTMTQPEHHTRTATLRDLTPTDKAKVSRLLRRVLSLSADNDRLSSAAVAAAAARSDEASELRKRLDVALDSLAEARRRAEAAEAKLRAAVGSCVCGAAAGATATAAGGGSGEAAGREQGRGNLGMRDSNAATTPATTTTTTASGCRNLVFNDKRGAFEFEPCPSSGEDEEPRNRAAAAAEAVSGSGDASTSSVVPSAPLCPPKQRQQQQRREGPLGGKATTSLQALVADVEASLAAAALRR